MASQDYPEITKYAGLVCAQAHRQELIQDLFKQWQDPVRGTLTGGMIKYSLSFSFFICLFINAHAASDNSLWFSFSSFLIILFVRRELLISFRRATGQKPQRIIFYR